MRYLDFIKVRVPLQKAFDFRSLSTIDIASYGASKTLKLLK